jgi:hypothetical protein
MKTRLLPAAQSRKRRAMLTAGAAAYADDGVGGWRKGGLKRALLFYGEWSPAMGSSLHSAVQSLSEAGLNLWPLWLIWFHGGGTGM